MKERSQHSREKQTQRVSEHKLSGTSCVESRRNTPVRRALVSLFQEANHPYSAVEVRGYLADRGLTVNKTTVYRQLETMTSEGLISTIDLGEGKKRYEACHGNEAHPHLICTRCGAIECLPVDDNLLKFSKRSADSRGFQLQGFSLELYGLCSHCRKELG